MSTTSKMSDQLAYLINQERIANGLSPLYAVPYLNECCMIRAEEQTVLAGHVRPNGQWFSDIIDWDIFSWGLISENIASGPKTAEEVVKYWKDSAGKVWSAAMNENFTHTGVGVYYDGNSKKWHWVQIYTNGAEANVFPGQYLPTGQDAEYPPEVPPEVPDMIISCKDTETGKEFSGLTIDITSTTNKNPNFSALKITQGEFTISYTTALNFYEYKTATFTTGITETKIFGLPSSETFIVKVHTPAGYYSTYPISTSDYYYTYTHPPNKEEQFSLNFFPREFSLKVVDSDTEEILSGAIFEFGAVSLYKKEIDDVEVIQNGQQYPHTIVTIAQNKKVVTFTTNDKPIKFRKIPGNEESAYYNDNSILIEKSLPDGYKPAASNILVYWAYTWKYLKLRSGSNAHIEDGNILVVKKEKNVINFYTFQQTLDGTLQELSGVEYKLSYSGAGTFTNTSSHDAIYINSAEKSISWTSTGTTQIFGLPNGSYQLEEVVTPDGFHKVKNITFDLISSEVKNAVNTFGEVIDNNIKIYSRMVFDKTVFQNDYITIYDSSTKQNGFDTHGLGVLTPTECLITEILNGKYELSITHPIDNDGKWRYIKESNIVKALGQLFTIKNVSYSYGAIKNEVTAKAEHIFYQQADWWIFPNPDTEKIFFTPGSSVSTFLDTIDALATKFISVGQTHYIYNWDSDIIIPQDTPLRELSNSEGISPVGAIMDSGGLLDTVNGELYRNNFYFSIRNRMENSSNNAFEIRIGSNLKGIKRTIDLTTFCTYFKAYNNYGSWFAVSWTNDSVLVLTTHNIIRSKKFSYTFDDENMTDEEKAIKADKLLEKDSLLFFGKTFKPLIAYEVDIEDVQQNPDFEEFQNKPDYRVGNIGTIYDEYFGEKIQLKITKTVKDAKTGKTKKVVFGEIRNFTNSGYDSIIGNTPIIQSKTTHITDSSGAFVYDAENSPIVEVTNYE